MRAHELERIGDFLDGWFSPTTRERMGQMVESLSSKG
jgi:hypothetical protein